MKAMQGLLFVLALLAPAAALAGPPFQTDDPEPVDFRHYELYTFGSSDGTTIETDSTGPALEFNWGAVPNVQLHIIVPLAAVLPAQGPSAYGLGDVETGVKWRFIQETKHRPMVGIFPMFEVPTGNPINGLGVGRGWARLPIWAQKSFGSWTTYGGVGKVVTTAPGYLDYAFGGWLVQRDIGKKLTLGTEVFSHGREGLATAQTRAATLVDVGGYYYFRNPAFQLLFCYGHSAFGQGENYAYVGLYWTWGNNKSDKTTASMANLLPRL
jgi:hypothetical protein